MLPCMLPCRQTLARPVSRDQTCGSGPLLLARFEDKSLERGFGTGTVSRGVRGGEEAVWETNGQRSWCTIAAAQFLLSVGVDESFMSSRSVLCTTSFCEQVSEQVNKRVCVALYSMNIRHNQKYDMTDVAVSRSSGCPYDSLPLHQARRMHCCLVGGEDESALNHLSLAPLRPEINISHTSGVYCTMYKMSPCPGPPDALTEAFRALRVSARLH